MSSVEKVFNVFHKILDMYRRIFRIYVESVLEYLYVDASNF